MTLCSKKLAASFQQRAAESHDRGAKVEQSTVAQKEKLPSFIPTVNHFTDQLN